MNTLSSRAVVLLGVLATLVLTGVSLSVIVLTGIGTSLGGYGFPAAARCTVPALTGTLVSVTTTDMGGPMMRGSRGMGGMRLTTDRATVQHGQVSFLVTNAGRLTHEMVILPLPGTQVAGTLIASRDGKINEASSLGEAAATCAEGEGQGILPGSSSWVTVYLPPGRYELSWNLPGHYEAGMYTQLTVT
ncbi:sulfocyanin-like copper-binding protein [Pseudarthrobacter sp. P1]|uniref:sulfocyanin-like copper-binding protein n=1 Tax=Pseudarthrobacter sp. P1 TaxID=3418418 RepID=UPI003CF0AB77